MKKQNAFCSRVFPGIRPRLLLASAFLAGGTLHATSEANAVAHWVSEDGVFDTPANWNTNAVPGPKMVATFAPQGAITITLSTDRILGGLDNQGTAMGDDAANLILDLGGHSLTQVSQFEACE